MRNSYFNQPAQFRESPQGDTSIRFRPMERDAFFNGALVRGYPPYSGVVLRPGQTVRIRHMSLSEQGYRYYLSLNTVILSKARRSRCRRPACAATW